MTPIWFWLEASSCPTVRSSRQLRARVLSAGPGGSPRAAGAGAWRGVGDSGFHLGGQGCSIWSRDGKLNAGWIRAGISPLKEKQLV